MLVDWNNAHLVKQIRRTIANEQKQSTKVDGKNFAIPFDSCSRNHQQWVIVGLQQQRWLPSAPLASKPDCIWDAQAIRIHPWRQSGRKSSQGHKLVGRPLRARSWTDGILRVTTYRYVWEGYRLWRNRKPQPSKCKLDLYRCIETGLPQAASL